MTKEEQKYREALISHCSYYNMNSLPASGDVLFLEISLKDVFFPLKLYRREVSDRDLSLESDRWNAADFWYFWPEIPKIKDSRYEELIDYINKQLERLYDEEKEESLSRFDSLLPQEKVKKEISTEDRRLFSEYDTHPVGPLIKGIPSRKIILSPPGYGKTTLVKRIALAYMSDDGEFKKDYHLPGDLYPVLLYCRSLDEIKIDEEMDFVSIVCEMSKTIETEISSLKFRQVLEQKAKEGSLLLLIDGLDEILQKENRNIFVSKLCDYLEKQENVHLIITSRKATFSGSDQRENEMIRKINSIPFVRRHIICPLEDDDIEEFVYRWYDVMYPRDKNRRDKANAILEQLFSVSNIDLSEMIKVPLHLSVVLLSARETNRLPDNIVELYQDYIDISLTWHAVKNDKEDRRRLLSYLAYHMMKNGRQRFSYTELKETFLSALQDLDGLLSIEITEEDVPAIIKEMEARNCLIQKCLSVNGEDYYEFVHLFLEEYLCAYAITRNCSEDSGELSVGEIVEQLISSTAFCETLALVFYQLDYDPKLRSKLIDMMIERFKEKEDTIVSNTLFLLLRRKVPMKKEKKKTIIDLIFSDKISFMQAFEIVESGIGSDDIEDYLTSSFKSSVLDGSYKYRYVYSAIEMHRMEDEGKNPFTEAEKLLTENEDERIVLGTTTLSMLVWLMKENPLRNLLEQIQPFNKSGFKLSPGSEKQIKKILLNKKEMIGLVTDLIEELLFSAHLSGTFLFDRDVYVCLVTAIKEDDPYISECAARILSLFPLKYSSAQYHREYNITELTDRFFQRYLKALESRQTEEAYRCFNICALLGAWDFREIRSEYNNLEAHFPTKNRKFNTYSEWLNEELRLLSDNPINKGFLYLLKNNTEEAMYCFLAAAYNWSSNDGILMLVAMPDWDLAATILQNHRKRKIFEIISEIRETQCTSMILWDAVVEASRTAKEEEVLNYQTGLELLKKDKDDLLEAYRSLPPFWSRSLRSAKIKELDVILAWLEELGCRF